MIITKIYIEENEKEYNIIIGKNRFENSEIIKSANLDDIWFHLEDFSGPHIIIYSNGDKIPKNYLIMIASLFPNYKNNLPKCYNVIYTTINNIKLTNIPGTVITMNTKQIKIS